MKINLYDLKIARNADTGHIKVYLTNDEIAEQYAKENRKPPPLMVVLTQPEAEFACDCLDGTAHFLPFFDDIGYKIKFAPDGIRVDDELSGHMKHYYFTFPGELLADFFREFVFDTNLIEREYDQTWIEDARIAYAPKPAMNVEQPVARSIGEHIRVPGLRDCIRSLARIARNHSHGAGGNSKLNITFDSWPATNDERPPSFYFWLENETGQSWMCGGVICHELSDGMFEYSTHT